MVLDAFLLLNTVLNDSDDGGKRARGPCDVPCPVWSDPSALARFNMAVAAIACSWVSTRRIGLAVEASSSRTTG